MESKLFDDVNIRDGVVEGGGGVGVGCDCNAGGFDVTSMAGLFGMRVGSATAVACGIETNSKQKADKHRHSNVFPKVKLYRWCKKTFILKLQDLGK